MIVRDLPHPMVATQQWIVDSIGATVLNGGAPTTLKNRVMGQEDDCMIVLFYFETS